MNNYKTSNTNYDRFDWVFFCGKIFVEKRTVLPGDLQDLILQAEILSVKQNYIS